jgi:hypothetical protein
MVKDKTAKIRHRFAIIFHSQPRELGIRSLPIVLEAFIILIATSDCGTLAGWVNLTPPPNCLTPVPLGCHTPYPDKGDTMFLS